MVRKIESPYQYTSYITIQEIRDMLEFAEKHKLDTIDVHFADADIATEKYVSHRNEKDKGKHVWITDCSNL